MRRLVGVVLAVIMLGATTAVPVASAGSLSWEPTEAGQHVEVPWAGVAITFPVDWEVTVHPEAWPKVTTDEGREFDTGVPVYRNALSSKGPMDEGFDSCTVYSYAYHALTPIDIAYPLAQIHGLGMTRSGTIELLGSAAKTAE